MTAALSDNLPQVTNPRVLISRLDAALLPHLSELLQGVPRGFLVGFVILLLGQQRHQARG